MKEFCINHKTEAEVAIFVKAETAEEAMKNFHNGEGYNQQIQLGVPYDEEIVDEQEITIDLIKGHAYFGKAKDKQNQYQGILFFVGDFFYTTDGYFFAEKEVDLFKDITTEDLINHIKESTEITPLKEIKDTGKIK